MEFGPRGRRLWAAYCELAEGEVGIAILEELCRTADRMDRLDALLSGEADSWCRLAESLDGFVLMVDQALSEARLQGQAFTRLWAALPLKAPDVVDDDGDGWLDMPASVLDPSGPAFPHAGG